MIEGQTLLNIRETNSYQSEEISSLKARVRLLETQEFPFVRLRDFDAKGDLLVGTADNTFKRLAVGLTNGFVFQVDNTAETGTKWATVPTAGIADLSVTTGKLADANVTNAKLANMAAATVKGRAVGAGTGVPVDLTATQTAAIVGSVGFASGLSIAGTASVTGGLNVSSDALFGTITPLAGVFGAAQVQVDRPSNATVLVHRESANAGAPTFEFLKRRSGWGVVSNGDRLGTIGWSGADSVDAAMAASIHVEVDGTPGSNDMPGAIVLSVAPDGSGTVAEAVRISQNKAVLLAAGLTVTSTIAGASIAVTGAITGASATITGQVLAAYDTNQAHGFGRAALGYNGFNDHMALAHVDRNNTTDYAIIQNTNGSTYVNAATGQALGLRINNADVAVVTAGLLAVTGDITVSDDLTVTDLLTLGTFGAWTNATYSTGWSTTAGCTDARYRKIGDTVEIEGTVAYAGGVGSNQIFALPVGFRPAASKNYPADAATITGGRAAVSTSGSVTMQEPSVGAGAQTYFTLDGIRFSTL